MKCIWIDCDNSPHVLFFLPIINELKHLGYDVLVTARDFAQTVGLLEKYGISHNVIGHHYGKKRILKVLGTFIRAGQLVRFAYSQKIAVSVGHGSRALALASACLRIPHLTLYDYEYVNTTLFELFAKKVLVPEVLTDDALAKAGISRRNVVRYPGIKENVYVPFFKYDDRIESEIPIDWNKIIMVIRPPGIVGHYDAPKSDELFREVVSFLSGFDDIQAVILPRTWGQWEEIKLMFNDWKYRPYVPLQPVDGLSLLWHADLLISGGGTMNREAAALGVPAYSVFSGPTGAVDQMLKQQGKLTFITDVADVKKIKIVKRLNKKTFVSIEDRKSLDFIVREIINMAEGGKRARRQGGKRQLPISPIAT